MGETPSRRGRTKARKKRNLWKRGAVIVFLLFACTFAYYGYSIWKFGGDIHDGGDKSRFSSTSGDPKTEQVNHEPPAWEGTERVNILLLGGDNRGLRENETPRSDTMLLLSVDPKTKKAHLFSILRDTYTNIPGYGHNRINAALVFGGPELAMKTVGDLLGISVQYYVYVDFQGFIALIDAIGGIEYYVEKDMYYTSKADGPEYDINLKEGQQHLDGKEALQYVRFRYDSRGDYARTERQRKFLKAVAGKMQTTASLIRLPHILGQIEPHIETNLTRDKMLRLGRLAFEVRNETMESLQIPPQNLLRETSIDGQSVLTVDEDSLRAFVREKFAESRQAEQAEIEPADTEGAAG